MNFPCFFSMEYKFERPLRCSCKIFVCGGFFLELEWSAFQIKRCLVKTRDRTHIQESSRLRGLIPFTAFIEAWSFSSVVDTRDAIVVGMNFLEGRYVGCGNSGTE